MVTLQSAKLHERACNSLALGVSTAFRKHVSPVPIYFERGDGPYLHDVDDNRFLDYALGWGPLIVGNNHPQLTHAIMEQLKHAYTYGAQHRGEILLAEQIVDAVPGIERVIFSNTGTEAVQAALRMARAYTAREHIIKFEGHYHGWNNNVLVSNHPSETQFGETIPDCGGQPASEYALTLTCPWNDLEALDRLLHQHQGKVAAVLTEPILINGGSCMPNDSYLSEVIRLCKKHGAVSIFDEVITGFRLALGGAREYFEVAPDLSVYAKAMGGGFSISAVAGSADLFATLEDGRTGHFGTYNGNPISVAAACATISILSEENNFNRMHDHGYGIRRAMEQAGEKHSIPLVTTGTGTAFHVHFGLLDKPRSYRDVRGANSELGEKFRRALFDRCIYTLPGGRWYVGTTHGNEQLLEVTNAIDLAMAEVAH